MQLKTDFKSHAIKLREQGMSYSEIQKIVPVSSSSLSLWLKGIILTEEQKHRLMRKGEVARKLGSKTLKSIRIKRTKAIVLSACKEIKKININNLLLLGSVLYWAEGSKQSEGNNVSKEVAFSNSDPKMIKVYLSWLDKCLKIDKTRIVFEIYIHESHKKTIKELISYWSKITGFGLSSFKKIYFKKNKIHTIRKNRGNDYSGVLRIRVKRSTDISRKIRGWVEGICLRVAEID